MDFKEPNQINTNERLQNMLKKLTNSKVEFVITKEECKKFKEINLKLELELKETRELEKSHRYHLQTSREMVGHLQDTVSQLVYLKRDTKKLNDDLASKDIIIASMEKDKEIAQQTHNATFVKLRKEHETHIEELMAIHEKRIQQVQYDSDTKIAQFACAVEELQGKIKDMEKEHGDKMNIVVLQYEEKIQRSVVEVAQLQEQLRMQSSKSDANLNAYRKKLEDLEEKLKQSQFKEYLAQSNYPLQNSHSQFENRVERPYSGQRDYTDTSNFKSIPVCPSPRVVTNQTPNNNLKTPSLKVMYHGNPSQDLPKIDNKGTFTVKKRKLYTEKI